MIDLDQAELKGIAHEPPPQHLCEIRGCMWVLVPLDTLRRVTREFDVDHIRMRRDRKFGK